PHAAAMAKTKTISNPVRRAVGAIVVYWAADEFRDKGNVAGDERTDRIRIAPECVVASEKKWRTSCGVAAVFKPFCAAYRPGGLARHLAHRRVQSALSRAATSGPAAHQTFSWWRL